LSFGAQLLDLGFGVIGLRCIGLRRFSGRWGRLRGGRFAFAQR